MSNNVPSTEDIRAGYTEGYLELSMYGTENDAHAEFDAWMAEHDKQVRIQTLKDFAFGARCEADYNYLNEGAQYLEKEENVNE